MTTRVRVTAALFAALLALPIAVLAHIGSPDVFVDAPAGPYRVLVTVRPPRVIPGVADVEVRSLDSVDEVRIVPLPLAGPGAAFAPAPDVAKRSADDPALFTGHLWMMTAGTWQVRVNVRGNRGEGVLSVPVPTLPQSTLAMSGPLRVILAILMIMLALGVVAIVSAAVREAGLEEGEVADARARRRGRVAGTIASGVMLGLICFGNSWWSREAASYARYVYKPLGASTAISPDGVLTLTLRDPGWIATRRTDDFVPDHDHVMHLFIVSPDLNRMWHLHPDESGTGSFDQKLPSMPPGQYELFADLVHATGVAETVTASLTVPEIPGAPLTGDDSAVATDSARLDPASFPLLDGGRVVWLRPAVLQPKALTMFNFRVDDPTGRPTTDLELYMGMPGHAIFVRHDRQIFAHVHPFGSAPMALLAMGQASLTPAEPGAAMTGMSAEHQHHAGALPATISFPYGFPEPGDYRIFVQFKRRGRIETAVFDAEVAADSTARR